MLKLNNGFSLTLGIPHDKRDVSPSIFVNFASGLNRTHAIQVSVSIFILQEMH